MTRAPELDQFCELVEQAGEGGEDDGVQRCDRAAAGGMVACVGVDAGGEAGDTVGQEWGLFF